MPTELINIAVQLPVVLLFLWFSDRMYNKFQDFLREERASRAAQSAETLAALKDIQESIGEYHAAVSRGIAVMEERTRPKNGDK